MKICLLCSAGGHLTEMMCLKDAWGKYDHFFMTQKNRRIGAIKDRAYMVDDPEIKPTSYPVSIMKVLRILVKERPDVILSTGFGWMDIPIFLFARVFGIYTIYIESWCRTKDCTGTGNVVKKIANEFLVQWPEMESTCGPGVKFRGGVI